MKLGRVATAGLCVVVSGCAAILGIDDGIPRDAGSDAAPDVVVEAGPDAAARCSPQKAFGTPVAVAPLDTGNDEALARLSRDELSLYFERASGSIDLYVATRASAAQPFDLPAAVASLDTGGLEADPSLAIDGKLLYFVTDREGGAGAYDIWTAAPDDAGFGALAPLSGVGSTGNEQYPYALASSLYFASDRAGIPAIYRADLAGASASNVTLVSPADAGVQIVPVVSEDELVMYFAAAGASDSSTDFDIWTTTRTATSQPWSTPVRVTELATTSAEYPTWLSPDLCRLYISTNRGGNYDIYLASRSP